MSVLNPTQPQFKIMTGDIMQSPTRPSALRKSLGRRDRRKQAQIWRTSDITS